LVKSPAINESLALLEL